MFSLSLIEIFTMIFVTMGPIKVLITFAEKSSGLESALRRRIAIKAVGVATVVGLIFVFAGGVLMEVFKFSSTAMSLAGGLILLIYSIKSILAEGNKETKYATDREAEQMAIYPLAVPLMASPMGLVTLTVISANNMVTLPEIIILAVMLLVVMGINLMALLFVDGVMKYLSPEVLGVANRILALLLAALAMETIINATGEVFQGAVGQLQEMGVIGK
jgi:multiple antibiotic resistance protein